MLIDNATKKQITLQPRKQYSDAFRRTFSEYKTPASHQGHPFFKLEERARIIQQ